jgi:hypothetical protein
VKLDRAARDLEEANSPTKLNWRETGWMWVPWISASAHAHADAYAAAPLLNASSFGRMPVIGCRPSPCFLRGCRRHKAWQRALPGQTIHPRRLSRTRTPHVVSFTAFVFIDRVRGLGHAFRSFFKTRCLFSSPAKLFQLPVHRYELLPCLCGGEYEMKLIRKMHVIEFSTVLIVSPKLGMMSYTQKKN